MIQHVSRHDDEFRQFLSIQYLKEVRSHLLEMNDVRSTSCQLKFGAVQLFLPCQDSWKKHCSKPHTQTPSDSNGLKNALTNDVIWTSYGLEESLQGLCPDDPFESGSHSGHQ